MCNAERVNTMQFDNDAYVRRISTKAIANPDGMLVLDNTVFYPSGGGQPGDTGVIELADGRRIHIIDTKRAPENPNVILHVPQEPIALSSGIDVIAEIDWDRRYRHMRMHTCLHLLCAVIDAPVTGCAIGAERGRLDFDLPEPTIDKETITARLSDLIARNVYVSTRQIMNKELQELPEYVRSRSVAPPVFDGWIRIVEIAGVDVQACGGTHVSQTGEIGSVCCTKIEKKSRHNRRVVIEFA